MAKVDYFIDELINEHKIRAKVFLIEASTEIIYPTDNLIEQLKCHRRQYLPTGTRKHEK